MVVTCFEIILSHIIMDVANGKIYRIVFVMTHNNRDSCFITTKWVKGLT
jgi:hypothetical protein